MILKSSSILSFLSIQLFSYSVSAGSPLMLGKKLITKGVQNMQEPSLLSVFPNVGMLRFPQGSCICPGDLHFPQGAYQLAAKPLGAFGRAATLLPLPCSLHLSCYLWVIAGMKDNNPPLSSTLNSPWYYTGVFSVVLCWIAD